MIRQEKPLAELKRRLKEDETAISRGALNDLAGRAETTLRALESLAQTPGAASQDDLHALRDAALNNMMLMDAARAGLNSVRKRMQQLEQVTNGTHTYGPDGNRNVFANTPPTRSISY